MYDYGEDSFAHDPGEGFEEFEDRMDEEGKIRCNKETAFHMDSPIEGGEME